MTTAFVEGSNLLAPYRRPHSQRHVCRRRIQRRKLRPQCSSIEKSIDTKILPEAPAGAVQSSTFGEWADSACISISNLDISRFSDGLRGLRALTTVLKNEPLISVPSDAALQVSSLDGTKSPFPEKVPAELWQRLSWYARLALMLHDKKSDPAWRGWIALLPKSFDTPIQWCESDLAELQSPRMRKRVHTQRKSYRAMYDSLEKCAITDSLSYDDFVWAINCVRSRAFSGPLETAPFKERVRLSAFIVINTLVWPALNVLGWRQALDGKYTTSYPGLITP